MKKKIFLASGLIAAVAMGVVGMSAFEAHVINVTAKIENALTVPMNEIDFGTVFPQEKFDRTFGVALSESFREAAGCGDNLLLNGGFEAPVVTDPAKWDIFPSGTPGLGWTVEWESAQTEYGGETRPDPALKELHAGVNGWLPQEGNQYAELDTDWDGPSGSLNNEPALVKIYQDISTNPGQVYELSYWFSPRPGTGAGDNTLLVRINGNLVGNPSAAGGANTNWTQYTHQFIAGGNTARVEFAGGGTANSLGVFLDNVSFVGCGRVASVDYVLRQKPKCVAADGSHPQVMHTDEGEFVCPDGSEMMPLLCPYLSKHETTTDGSEQENDGGPLTAFHGLPGAWDMTKTVDYELDGRLSVPAGDLDDEWLIDLKVPCFNGMCAQDWAEFVRTESGNPDINPDDYMADPELNSEVFGCDLWLEVTGIQGMMIPE